VISFFGPVARWNWKKIFLKRRQEMSKKDLDFETLMKMSKDELEKLLDEEGGEAKVMEVLNATMEGLEVLSVVADILEIAALTELMTMGQRQRQIGFHPDFAQVELDEVAALVIETNVRLKACAGCPAEGCRGRRVDFDVVVLKEQIEAARAGR
jgi:hypothetical protein